MGTPGRLGLGPLLPHFAAATPRSDGRLFFVTLVIALVIAGWGLRSLAPFPRQQAIGFWLQAHGYAMLMGTVAIFFGLALGVMFLVQSWRLKHKRLGKAGLRLPPLEWLQRGMRVCLAIGTLSIAAGLCAGVIST